MNHAAVVEHAATWAKKKYPLVITELVSAAGEVPDVLAFNASWSVLIECKASRADFLGDHKKPWRQPGYRDALGSFRMYCAPKGIIKKEELPDRWGLLEINDKGKVRQSQKPGAASFKRLDNEATLLISLLRRIGPGIEGGVSIKTFTHETQNKATASFEKEDTNEPM